MIIKDLPEEFHKALPVLQSIQKAGYEAYFVGGSVRDTLLGLPIHDVDIASSAYPAEIKSIFKRTVDTGIEHGTVMVLDHGKGYEVTTFRTESGYQDFRRPDKVTFVRSLAEDLKRRDLTINALAMNAAGEVVDLFTGMRDLKYHEIRAVGKPEERFHEDALRMMRAVRFASKLDFYIENETLAAISDNAELLSKIAIERIHEEWVKLMLGLNPARGLESFVNTGLYKYCPDFCDKRQQFEEMIKLPKIDLSSEEAVWTFLAYELKCNSQELTKLMRDWKCSNDMIKQTQAAYQALKAIMAEQATTDVLYRTGIDMLRVANQVTHLFNRGMNDDYLLEAYNELPIKSKHELKINGKDLIVECQIKPGPQMGKILNQLEEGVVNSRIANEHDLLVKRAQLLASELN